MERFNYYEHIKEVLEEATEHFVPIYKINEQKYKKLKENCDLISKFILYIYDFYNEVESELETYLAPILGCGMKVDGKTKNITAYFDIRDFIIENKPNNFSKILLSAKELRFKPLEDNDIYMRMEIVFDGIWDKVK